MTSHTNLKWARTGFEPISFSRIDKSVFNFSFPSTFDKNIYLKMYQKQCFFCAAVFLILSFHPQYWVLSMTLSLHQICGQHQVAYPWVDRVQSRSTVTQIFPLFFPSAETAGKSLWAALVLPLRKAPLNPTCCIHITGQTEPKQIYWDTFQTWLMFLNFHGSVYF